MASTCKAYNVQEGEVIGVCLVRAINHEDVVKTAGKVLGHVRLPKEIPDMVVLVHCNCAVTCLSFKWSIKASVCVLPHKAFRFAFWTML